MSDDNAIASLLGLTLMVGLVLVVECLRMIIGQGRPRGQRFLRGALGGLACGALISQPLASYLQTDMLLLCAVLGLALGCMAS